jgi:hypothetical protein
VKQLRRAAELTSHALDQLRGAQIAGGIAANRAQKIEGRLLRRLTRLERHGGIAASPDLIPNMPL